MQEFVLDNMTFPERWLLDSNEHGLTGPYVVLLVIIRVLAVTILLL